jgi:shikimate dehydrogenase
MVRDLAGKTNAAIQFEHWRGSWRVPSSIDLLVNATSIGLYPNVGDMPAVDLSSASPRLLVSDAVPNPPETAFLRTAKGLGLPVLDGLSMLVHQGAIGFRMWTGQDPPQAVMKEALRAALADSATE